MPLSPQMRAIIARIQRQTHIFDFDREGLGEAICKIVANDIYRAMSAECDPDGNAWPELSESYAKWKAVNKPGAPMGVLEGAMKTVDQLLGQRTITRNQIVQTYGDGSDPDAVDHFLWFSEGDPSRGRPPRPFWMIGPIARAELDAFLSAWFAQRV